VSEGAGVSAPPEKKGDKRSSNLSARLTFAAAIFCSIVALVVACRHSPKPGTEGGVAHPESNSSVVTHQSPEPKEVLPTQSPTPAPQATPHATPKPKTDKEPNPNAAATPGMRKGFANGVVAGTDNGGARSGKLIRSPKPPYPPQALQMHITGDVMLSITVSAGHITDVEAVSGPGILWSAAERWVRSNWEFAPDQTGTFTFPVVFQIPSEMPTPTPTASPETLPTFFPPKATSTVELPINFAQQNLTLERLSEEISEALTEAGYEQRSYFWLDQEHGPGFAIITHIEQIQANGFPVTTGRWSFDLPVYEHFSITSFLKAMIKADPGNYRMIALVVSRVPFQEKDEAITEAQVAELNAGPKFLAKAAESEVTVNPSYHCIAYIYEFERSTRNDDPKFKVSSTVSASDHLKSTPLWAALSRLR
jgi:hypothetical protein